MNSKRLLSMAVVAAVAIGGGLAAGHWVRGDLFENSAQAATTKTADPVAALWAASVTDTEGAPQSLASFKGQKVVVNFWASWCGPCVQEMSELVQLSHEYKNRGIHFLGVAVDSDKNVQAFLKKVKVDYPVVVSGYAGIDLVRNFGNTAGTLPLTVAINTNGRVRVKKLGQIQPNELKKTLDTL
ncbi:MAG: TlpA disulfide reductase family protein [Burkholderia sp.]